MRNDWNWKSEYRQIHWVLFLLFGSISPFYSDAQNEDKPVFGEVVDAANGMAIPGVHVVNTRSERGTLTDLMGRFSLACRKGDTLVFSHLSFAFSTFSVEDSTFGEPQKIALKERNYLLDEVGIFAYELTTNEPRDMKIDEPLVPKEENIELPYHTPPTLANPVDLLYEQFGKTPRQLRELRRLLREDAWKRKLAGRNGQILRELTGMSREEVALFTFYCRHGPGTIRHATDYQLLMSLMECYDEYRKEREVEELLEEWD